MRPAELSSPIRILWDIGPQSAGLVDHRRIAGELAAHKVLQLQITDQTETLSPACFTILDELKATGIGLSLVVSPAALDAASLERLCSSPLRMLLLSTTSIDDLDNLGEASKHIAGRVSFGVAFAVAKKNVAQLPEILAYCIQYRIAHLLVPIQRFKEGDECFLLSLQGRQALAERLAQIERPNWLKIVIHDPFLWRSFYPAVEFPDGGCQAANTMLHITASGDVYPCPAFPVKLGNLMSSSLRSIISSERKKELRASIISPPRACFDCDSASQCRGGCRGRGYWMTDSLQTADPACR